jgi:hypothetical protein
MPEYVVGVNPDTAFSLSYEDEQGRLLFAIEVDDTPNTVYLNPRPTENGRMVDFRSSPEKERVAVAVERVIAYLQQQNLVVDID